MFICDIQHDGGVWNNATVRARFTGLLQHPNFENGAQFFEFVCERMVTEQTRHGPVEKWRLIAGVQRVRASEDWATTIENAAKASPWARNVREIA